MAFYEFNLARSDKHSTATVSILIAADHAVRLCQAFMFAIFNATILHKGGDHGRAHDPITFGEIITRFVHYVQGLKVVHALYIVRRK
jgi:hypothetical protein